MEWLKVVVPLCAFLAFWFFKRFFLKSLEEVPIKSCSKKLKGKIEGVIDKCISGVQYYIVYDDNGKTKKLKSLRYIVKEKIPYSEQDTVEFEIITYTSNVEMARICDDKMELFNPSETKKPIKWTFNVIMAICLVVSIINLVIIFI